MTEEWNVIHLFSQNQKIRNNETHMENNNINTFATDLKKKCLQITQYIELFDKMNLKTFRGMRVD